MILPQLPAKLRRASPQALCALALSGCAASFQIPPNPPPPALVDDRVTARDTVREFEDTMCLVRARRFRGMVMLPCIELARQANP